MTKVPAAVRTVFEAVPLRTVPDVEVVLEVEKRWLCWEGEPRRGSGGSTLVVHALMEWEGLAVPTDPVCLAEALALCRAKGVWFGRGEQSPHALAVLLACSQPDKQLPVEVTSRAAVATQQVMDLLGGSGELRLLVELLRLVVVDGWVVEVMRGGAPVLQEVYGDDYPTALEGVVERTGFRLRHPRLVPESVGERAAAWLHGDGEAAAVVARARSTMQQFEQRVASGSLPPAPAALVAAVTVCAARFAPRLLPPDFPALAAHAHRLLHVSS